MESPLVCVCIPSYNCSDTISETLNSILAQTYSNILIKVFDNASSDTTAKIVEEYAVKNSNIILIKNEENIGGEANFTKCIQNGEGTYTAVFHADDIYLPTMVEEQVRFLEKYSECSGVAVHAKIINKNGRIVGERFLPCELKNENEYIFDTVLLLKKTLKYGNFITCPSVMARTNIYKDYIAVWNGGDYKTSADLDVWLRLSETGGLGFISKPLMHYRHSTASFSYNFLRVRTSRQDIFLVLQDYLKRDYIQEHLSYNDDLNYLFLLFKDDVAIGVNQLIQFGRIANMPSIFSLSVMLVSIKSLRNFKIYLIAVIIFIFKFLYLPPTLRGFLYRIRFGR